MLTRVRRTFWLVLALSMLALAAPSLAAAQNPVAPAPPATPPQATPPITAGWQDGFVLQSGNGDFRLQLGVTAQTDGRFVLDDDRTVVDTFTVRKFRLGVTGRVGKYFDFKVVPELGSGSSTVLDASFDVRFSPKFRVRTGKDKTPVGYEILISDPCLPFPERSLASSLMPNRDIGVQAQGDLIGGKASYSGGVFNGIVDGTSGTTELDTNSGKDLAGRLLLQPFRSPQRPPTALSGLGVHIGGSTGKQIGALPVFRTSSTQTYFSYASGTVAAGRRDRFSPAVSYYYKSLGAFAELTRSTQTVTRADQQLDLTNQGWEVTGSYLVTGEPATERDVRPARAFDPAAGKWGALQLLVRYSTLRVDPRAFTAGLAAAGSSQRARAFIIAANWYPVSAVKYYLTFERTAFEGGAGTRPTEHLILFRAQLAF